MALAAPALSVRRTYTQAGFVAPLACITALAAALRLAGESPLQLNPFYDAAVRTMAQSLHAFFLGTLDPSGRLAIDKPAPALWAQVAAVKLLGYGPRALLAPAALAGTAAVALLGVTVRRMAGPVAGLVAAAALAVLPVAVLTERSDTPDALMMLATVAAAYCALRARAATRAWALGAGACAGLAFEAKLTEALIVAVPLALVLPRRSLPAAAAAFAAVALAWPLAVALAPGSKPWVLGSSDGRVWSMLLSYNGTARLAGALPSSAVPPPGPLRLLTGAGLGRLVGVELAPALVLAALALRKDRNRAVVLFAVWLVLGFALFSTMARLHVRYLEALAPAIAATLALGVNGFPQGKFIHLAVPLMLAPAALFAVEVVTDHASDGGHPGVRPPAEVAALSAYLRAHDGAARYEAAEAFPDTAAPLVAHDGRPVLLLAAAHGRPLVPTAALQAAVRSGAVRYAYLGVDCGQAARAYCPASALWARRHGVDVSLAAGLPVRGRLYRLGAPA